MNLRKPLRKLAVGGAVVAATLTLSGSSAFAFECYTANRSAQGNASAAKAPALISFEEALVAFCGIDPAATGAIIEAMGDQGFKTDFLINGHTLMAGGLEKNGKGDDLLHNQQGIDHLSGDFFAALFVLAPTCDS